ncbi:cytochrome P450 [Annulohypoxylon nitens]|nr:cytochrome P450 [Annulohypoxylon nitens]
MNGTEWKNSRALFNSGFSASYILQQTSHIVDETEVYVDVLREHARKGKIFSLDDVTLWYMMDVIGSVTLDSRLHSLRQFNPLASALRRQIRWHVLDNEWNLLIRWNPARPFVQAYNSYQMNKYIGQELDKRYAEWTEDEAANSSRSIIHLALAGYMAQQKDKSRPKKLDPAFKDWATVQIRLFLFAGHDSTSSTICYCFYLLQCYPDAMAKLRAEHDAVFGTDITKTPKGTDIRPRERTCGSSTPPSSATRNTGLRRRNSFPSGGSWSRETRCTPSKGAGDPSSTGRGIVWARPWLCSM